MLLSTCTCREVQWAMVSVFISRLSGPGLGPCQEHCVVVPLNNQECK